LSPERFPEGVCSLHPLCAPAQRPQLNGAVERAQSSWRYEFYACYDLPARLDKLQAFIEAFVHRFNHVRPNDALILICSIDRSTGKGR
jgi:Integrase core domain